MQRMRGVVHVSGTPTSRQGAGARGGHRRRERRDLTRPAHSRTTAGAPARRAIVPHAPAAFVRRRRDASWTIPRGDRRDRAPGRLFSGTGVGARSPWRHKVSQRVRNARGRSGCGFAGRLPAKSGVAIVCIAGGRSCSADLERVVGPGEADRHSNRGHLQPGAVEEGRPGDHRGDCGFHEGTAIPNSHGVDQCPGLARRRLGDSGPRSPAKAG